MKVTTAYASRSCRVVSKDTVIDILVLSFEIVSTVNDVVETSLAITSNYFERLAVETCEETVSFVVTISVTEDLVACFNICTVEHVVSQWVAILP